MVIDFSIFFDRLGEQFQMTLIMLARQAVQRQLLAIIVILLVSWLAPKLVDMVLKRAEKPKATGDGKSDAPPTLSGGTRDAGGQVPTRGGARAFIIRWLRAIDFVLFPLFYLLLSQRAIQRFAENEWPSGLLSAMMPVFWLILGYRFVIGIILAALPEDRSHRFAAQVVRPVLWILILLIVRSILFSTLGLSEISLLRFGEVTINLGSLLNALISVLLAMLAGWTARSMVAGLLVRSGAEPDVANTVSNVTRYAVISLGAVIALGILGVDLGALAWIGGGLSLGLGFGLQELFGNFVSGIVLVFERILRPGDIIEVQGLRGVVTKVAMRATILKTADNSEIFVPNKELMTKAVYAFTYSDRTSRVKLDLAVTYDTDFALAERVLMETIRRHPLILAEPEPGVLIVSMDPYSIQFAAFGYVREFGDSFRVKSELYQMVRDAFALHHIVIPVPRQEIKVVTMDGAPSPDGKPASRKPVSQVE